MAYTSTAEAYTALKAVPREILEARTENIKNEVRSNPSFDLNGAKFELEAIKQIMNEQPIVTNVAPMLTAAETRTQGDPKAEYRSAFDTFVQGRTFTADEQSAFDHMRETRADAGFNTTDNTAAIPTVMLDEVIAKARKQHAILGLVRNFSMPSYIDVPIGADEGNAVWHQQGQGIDSKVVGTSGVHFKSNEIVSIRSVSKSVDTLAIDALESYVTDLMSQDVMEAIAKAVVVGTGDGQPEGILTGIEWEEGTNMVTTDALGWRDVAVALGLLEGGYSTGAVIACSNKTFWQWVVTLHDDNDRPVWTASTQEGAPSHVLGKPVYVDDFVPDGTILVGAFDYYGVNIVPDSMALEVSRDSSFKNNLIDYKFPGIVDGKVLVPEAFAKLVIED